MRLSFFQDMLRGINEIRVFLFFELKTLRKNPFSRTKHDGDIDIKCSRVAEA